MARTLLAVTFCLAVAPIPAAASDARDVDALMRHYDSRHVASGQLGVSTEGEFVYVRGLAPGMPWVDVWRLADGEWTLVAEMKVTELAPIRFGAKRNRSCRT